MKNEEQILAILKVLAQGQAEIQAEQQQTNQRLDKLEQGQSETNQRFDNLTEDVEKVRQIAVKTEYDLGQQTAIIREGFYDNQKLVDNYEPRISKLEDTVENLAIDVNYIKSAI